MPKGKMGCLKIAFPTPRTLARALAVGAAHFIAGVGGLLWSFTDSSHVFEGDRFPGFPVGSPLPSEGSRGFPWAPRAKGCL